MRCVGCECFGKGASEDGQGWSCVAQRRSGVGRKSTRSALVYAIRWSMSLTSHFDVTMKKLGRIALNLIIHHSHTHAPSTSGQQQQDSSSTQRANQPTSQPATPRSTRRPAHTNRPKTLTVGARHPACTESSGIKFFGDMTSPRTRCSRLWRPFRKRRGS